MQHQLELCNCRKGKANHYQMHLCIHFIIIFFLCYHQAPNALYWQGEVIENNTKENFKVTLSFIYNRETLLEHLVLLEY